MSSHMAKLAGIGMIFLAAATSFAANVEPFSKLDEIKLGDVTAEKSHSLIANSSEIINGAFDDPIAVGAAQQALEDNQYFVYIAGRLKDSDTLGMMRNIDEYAKVKTLPKSSYSLPMTRGQPDFVFADEENAVLAIKDGDSHLFVNFYYRAERAVNSVARIFEMTPDMTRVVTARTYAEAISSGHTYTRPDWIDWARGLGLPPPGQDIHQAWAGEVMPVSARPDDATISSYDNWGPFLGKAAYYQFEYGPYLIMMNSSEDKDHAVVIPPAFVGAHDLISGQSAGDLAGFLMKPLTTIVLRKVHE